ncbi:molybdate ABC transporter substrate-binding protein [Lentzea nigeriaca]|uniref:molybdate ABC transporter substrate-binding protein n=1 Tax=Lentzea nigeriaca TaxID=1128665 RepID=UPI0019571EBA|nr:molybdate ABC transporter substrate-binding protein [Lentzea nigeriaca]MBM7856819.1 molybdate transport system substrate-binding protein [Lentzea nigeriaca]
MTKRFPLLLVAVLAACSSAPKADAPPPRREPKPLTVYADSALTESFTKIAKDFEASQGIEVELVFDAGSALEKHADEADVFASASRDNMKYDSKVFAVTGLVLAIKQGNPKNVRALESFSAQANPRASFAMCAEETPCGVATKAALTAAGLADATPAAVGNDVKDTLKKLTAGDVDSAFVYATDAKPDLGIFSVPVRADQRFPIAVVSGSPESKKFYDYVFSEQGRARLTEVGFELP